MSSSSRRPARLLHAAFALLLLLLAGSASSLLTPSTAVAEEQSEVKPAAAKAEETKMVTGFEPGTNEEQVSGFNLMVIAYLAFWGVLFVYFLSLVGRQKKLKGELGELKARLDALEERTKE